MGGDNAKRSQLIQEQPTHPIRSETKVKTERDTPDALFAVDTLPSFVRRSSSPSSLNSETPTNSGYSNSQSFQAPHPLVNMSPKDCSDDPVMVDSGFLPGPRISRDWPRKEQIAGPRSIRAPSRVTEETSLQSSPSKKRPRSVDDAEAELALLEQKIRLQEMMVGDLLHPSYFLIAIALTA